jgi:hypothetical protein
MGQVLHGSANAAVRGAVGLGLVRLSFAALATSALNRERFEARAKTEPPCPRRQMMPTSASKLVLIVDDTPGARWKKMAVAIAQQDRGDPELVEARPGLLGTVMSEVWRGSGASRRSPSAFGDGG